MNDWYRWRDEETLQLDICVQPRASRDEIAGPHGDCLKVRLTAPPVEGRANQRLLRLLAKAFAVAPSRVHLEAGTKGRVKRVTVHSPRRLPNGIRPYTEA